MNSFYIEPEKQIPVRDTADVIVAGGGTAGCIAAIAAAREGAKVVLIEKQPLPGGNFTQGGMVANSFYAFADEENNSVRVVDGLAKELIDRMEEAGGCPGFIPTRVGNLYRRPYLAVSDHEIFKSVMAKMLLEAGVHVYLQTTLSDVIMEGSRICGVIIESKSGREVLYAKQFVDATGDGDLARLAGAPVLSTWESFGVDQIGLIFGMNGIDFEKIYAYNKEEPCLHLADSICDDEGHPVNGLLRYTMYFMNNPKLAPIVEAGIRSLLLVSLQPNRATYMNVINIKKADVMDVETASVSELQLRIKMIETANLLKTYMPGFENAYVDWSSSAMGVRSSNVIRCRKELTLKDVEGGLLCDHTIGLYGYQDLAPLSREKYHIKGKGYYGIPFEAIQPEDVDNLLVSGRMISPQFEANMSTRNTVCCMVTGQAAGIAAAVGAKSGTDPQNMEYEMLKEHLLAQKMILELP